MRSILRVLALAACAGTLVPASAVAQSMVGTLKCTADVTQTDRTAARDWKLACVFEPAKGPSQHFSGAVNDPGSAPRATGKAFLVWNVLAAAPEVQAGMLVGTYKEGKAGANGLVGGRNGAILLQPIPGPGQQDGINVAPRVSAIRLELPKA